MKDELNNDNLIKDFEKMTRDAENFQNNMDLYCEFMKKVFLSGSCLN